MTFKGNLPLSPLGLIKIQLLDPQLGAKPKIPDSMICVDHKIHISAMLPGDAYPDYTGFVYPEPTPWPPNGPHVEQVTRKCFLVSLLAGHRCSSAHQWGSPTVAAASACHKNVSALCLSFLPVHSLLPKSSLEDQQVPWSLETGQRQRRLRVSRERERISTQLQDSWHLKPQNLRSRNPVGTSKPSVVMLHACDRSTWETEAGGSQVWGELDNLVNPVSKYKK